MDRMDCPPINPGNGPATWQAGVKPLRGEAPETEKPESQAESQAHPGEG